MGIYSEVGNLEMHVVSCGCSVRFDGSWYVSKAFIQVLLIYNRKHNLLFFY